MSEATAPARVLLVSADEGVVDDVLRLAAAADVAVDVVGELSAARRAWPAAALVLVGHDALPALALRPPPRRGEVVVVGADLDDATIWQRAVAVGAEHVVFPPDADEWLVERLAEAVAGAGAQGRLAVVLGGRGGAGSSTLTVALGVAASRRGLGTLLVDADPLGGGLDLVLGAEETPGLRWPELAGARGRIAGESLAAALPAFDGLTVLSWDRFSPLDLDPDALSSVLAAGVRAHDLVVVDLARWLGPIAEEALARADVVWLVVPAEVRAAAAAARVAQVAASIASRVEVVVRGPAPGGLPAEVVADSLGLPLAGYMRAEPGLAAALERGEPPGRGARGPLARLCGHLLDSLVPGPSSRAA
ncbi:MAG TPA: septum site-determining protein Ssd [Actinomycetes bacterium]|nr:septum site-determining protein Ssd [Actinomycetes bacterium]